MLRLTIALGFVLALSTAALAADKSPWLPDPVRTPGATNPAITQENIDKTICNHGHWSTKSIRPPASFTNRLKRKQIAEWGLEGSMQSFEEDHLIPLTLGGAPRDPRNLWPQIWDGDYGAHVKDRLEVKINKLVCSGKLTLKEAQDAISTDWVAAYRKFVEAE